MAFISKNARHYFTLSALVPTQEGEAIEVQGGLTFVSAFDRAAFAAELAVSGGLGGVGLIGGATGVVLLGDYFEVDGETNTITLKVGADGLATEAFITAALDALIASAPAALDTLNELAAALGSDPSFATTMATALGNRLRFDAVQSLTGGQKTQVQANAGLVIGTDVQAFRAALAEAEIKAANVASAATVNLDAVAGDFLHITGNNTINTMTLSQGREKTVVFDGAPTLTHSSGLILPNSGNSIPAAAGDVAVFRGEGSSVTRCVLFRRANGTALREEAQVANPSVGYVQSNGNDGTGAMGNPAKPYATMQAAYNAGARVFELGVGIFAGFTLGNNDPIYIRGQGHAGYGIGDLKTQVGLIDCAGMVLTLIDIGVRSFLVGEIRGHGANGANSTGTADGENGGWATNAKLVNVIAGSVNLYGGTGGAGHHGGGTPTNAGSGGGGGELRAWNSVIQDVGVDGGTGGADISTGNPGHGGPSGSIYLYDDSHVRSGWSASGGNAGDNSISGSAANGGDCGTVWCERSRMNNGVMSIGAAAADGTAGIDGTFVARWAEFYSPSGTSTLAYTVVASIRDDVFVA